MEIHIDLLIPINISLLNKMLIFQPKITDNYKLELMHCLNNIQNYIIKVVLVIFLLVRINKKEILVVDFLLKSVKA